MAERRPRLEGKVAIVTGAGSGGPGVGTGKAISILLAKEGGRVLLVDSNRRNVGRARLVGLDAAHMNLLGENSLEELDLGGLGQLLALTPNDEVNSLSSLHFSEVFGRANVYQFTPANLEKIKETVPKHLRGRYLFGDEFTFEYLRRRWDRGWFRRTRRRKGRCYADSIGANTRTR